MRWALVTLAVWAVAGASARPGRADLTERVLARLRTADEEVVHGTVVYREEEHMGPPLSAEEISRRSEVQERYYRQMGYDARRTAEAMADFRRYLRKRHGVRAYTVRLTYLDRLHYKKKVYGAEASLVPLSLRDGSSGACVIDKQMLVDDRLGTQMPSLIELDAGPCFPMGRGLSKLKRPTIRKAEEGIVVSGTAPDGTSIRAIVDPEHGYTAKRIERYARRDGRLLQVYTLSTPRLVNNTVWIPARVLRSRIPRDGQLRSVHKYVLIHADFHRPEASEVAVSLEGLEILDFRMKKGVRYNKVPAGAKTLDDLLPYTRKVAEDLARVQAQFDREQAKRRRVQVLIGLLFGCTAAAAGVIAWRSYRGLRRAQGRV